MSSSLVIAKRKAAQFTALFRTYQPPFDNTGNAPLQDHAHSFLFKPGGRSAGEHPFADELGESAYIEWFHDDFVRFEKDSGHGALYVGVAADQQGQCIGLGVSHRGNHPKTVTRIRHVQVGYEHVKALGSDSSQRASVTLAAVTTAKPLRSSVAFIMARTAHRHPQAGLCAQRAVQ
jgi:hypothetical protein